MNAIKDYGAGERYDQYTQYQNLSKLLKRFSFQEKMYIASYHSSKAISFSGDIRRKYGCSGVFPWCIETFVMLAMESSEYGSGDFRGKNEKKFIQMCNAIWSATETELNKSCGRFSFIDIFFACTGLIQFSIQENPWVIQYRYWKIFNDDSHPVCMKTVFKEKMGADYEDFLLLGRVLQILFKAQIDNHAVSIPQRALKHLLFERFSGAAKQLVISREEYVSLQRKLAGNANDTYRYIYSLRPSYQYALVREKDVIYFPLPHLLNANITSALYYRVTENDDALRGEAGKYLWEKYLMGLINGAGCYDKVFPEQPYRFNGCAAKSPDILACQGKEVLFLDSKSTVPSIGIRLMDTNAFESNINIVGENIKKLYNQIHRFEKYNPFGQAASKNKDDHWGIVTVLEDSYIPRKRYYEKAGEMLGIKVDSEEWNWMITQIKVISFYEIERVSLYGYSLIDACKAAFNTDPFGMTFAGFPFEKNIKAQLEFATFQKQIVKKEKEVICEMVAAGVIPEA